MHRPDAEARGPPSFLKKTKSRCSHAAPIASLKAYTPIWWAGQDEEQFDLEKQENSKDSYITYVQ